MARYFHEEDSQELSKLLGGVAPNELRRPIPVDMSHGVETVKCPHCKEVIRDTEFIEISRDKTVYQCPKCMNYFYSP